MKTKWLDRNIGPAGPFLALCLSEDEFRAAIRRMKVKSVPRWVGQDAHASMHTFESPTGGPPVCIVCLADWSERSPVEVAATLVHEAVHIWQEHCEYRGETNPGREQMAYGIDRIAGELMAEFARRMS